MAHGVPARVAKGLAHFGRMNGFKYQDLLFDTMQDIVTEYENDAEMRRIYKLGTAEQD